MKSKDIIIILLVIMVLGLSGYIIYDKIEDDKNSTVVNDNNKCQSDNDSDEKDNNDKEENIVNDNQQNNNQNNNVNTNITIKEESKEFFDEYLKIFLPGGSASNFLRTINKFNDRDISIYLLFYYSSLNNSGEISAVEDRGSYTYDITKEEIDAVVYKYFGIKDYNVVESNSRTGIRKLENGKYQVYWFATGWMSPTVANTMVKYNGNQVIVEYELIETYGNHKVGSKLTFNLVYNDGNYNVISVIFDE